MHEVLLDSIAACGDVNRNVMAPPNPERSPLLQQVYDARPRLERIRAAQDPRLPRNLARRRARRRRRSRSPSRCTARPICRANSRSASPCRPPTTSTSSRRTSASSPSRENGKLVGYNVTVGGGLGMSHGNEETFPRLADVLGFIPADRVRLLARRGGAHHAARLRRPDQPQARAPQIHHRGSRRRLVQGRGREALGRRLRSPRGPSISPPSKTPTAGTRAPMAAGSTACTSSSGRIKDPPGWPMKTAPARDRADPHRRFPPDAVAKSQHRRRDRRSKSR